MSKPVHSDQEVPADVETAFGVLTDESWPQRRNEALHDGSTVVRREETPDGGVVMVVSRELPAGVPSFLEKFLPKEGRVTQTDTWAPASGGRRTGTWAVEIPGAPARLGGTMHLEPTASGCRYVIDGTIEVKIPLVGGKAEGFVAGMVEKVGVKEADVLRSAVAPG